MWNIYIYDKWNKQNPIAVGRLFGICFYFCSDNVLLCSKYGITVMLLVPISVCLIQAFVAKKTINQKLLEELLLEFGLNKNK